MVKDIQEFLKQLYPYSLDVEIFNIEEDDSHMLLDDVMFFAILAK